MLGLAITCLGGRFGINCPISFLKSFKNQEGDFEPNMWLLVNQTKPTCFVLKLVSFNCRQLQIRERAIGQIQNNSANDEVLVTINRAIK